MLKAMLAGSFDPPTWGHIGLIARASRLTDQLLVAIAENSSKEKSLLTTEEKVKVLKKETKKLKNVEIISFSGLLASYAEKNGVNVLIRGLRSQDEYEAELQMAIVNRKLIGIDTLFLMAESHVSHISSSLIKELALYHVSLKDFVPLEAEKILRTRIQKEKAHNGTRHSKVVR